jgi:hypothetical protein
MSLQSNAPCDLDLPRHPTLKSGVLGGLCAGLAMAAVLGADAQNRSGEIGLPFRLISKGLFGGLEIESEMIAPVLGLILHLGISVSLGAGFSFLIRCHVPGSRFEEAGDRALVSGALFAAAIWATATFLILPWLNPAFLSYVMAAPTRWFLIHMVYGAMLLTILAFRKQSSLRKARLKNEQTRRAA